MLVWLNGQFIDRDNARISAFDAGFQHGVGLFETMLAQNKHVFRVADHMQRLKNSAKELLLSESLRVPALCEAIDHVVEKNELDRARVRLTITGGDLGALPSSGSSGQDPTILIVAQPPTEYPPGFFEQGVTVLIADGRVSPLDPMAGHKTLNYWSRIRALQGAAQRGAGEVLWFSVTNHVACGSVSNVFVVKNDTLLTPIAHGEEPEGALRAPVLPGITRSVILECAETLNVSIERKLLDINDIFDADEVFLTNSSWGVLPVTGVEQEKIADGQVGPMTRRLRDGWLETVEVETTE